MVFSRKVRMRTVRPCMSLSVDTLRISSGRNQVELVPTSEKLLNYKDRRRPAGACWYTLRYLLYVSNDLYRDVLLVYLMRLINNDSHRCANFHFHIEQNAACSLRETSKRALEGRVNSDSTHSLINPLNMTIKTNISLPQFII